MVIFKEYPDILDEISQFKVKNSTKILLKSKGVHKEPLEVVIKKSDTKKEQLLFAVFTQVDKTWICKEYGYHSDIKTIEKYLLNKYFKEIV